MTQQEIILKITDLQDRINAASLECIHCTDRTRTKKYLESVQVHAALTKELNRLKELLKETA